MVLKYRKPRTINGVSIGLFLFFGVLVYLAVYAWPVYTLSSRAKGVLLDALPMFWRANLRPNDVATEMISSLKKSIPLALRKAGVQDPDLEVVFNRSKTEVSIEAHFTASAYFPVIDKSYDFELSPRAVTDAARVEW